MKRARRLRETLGIGLVAVMALAACGGDDGAGDQDVGGGAEATYPLPDPMTQLVGLLPEEAPRVAVIDLVALREALELPDDQGIDGRLDERTQPLAFALQAAIPSFALPQSPPILEELDTGAMTAAASVPIGLAPDLEVVVVQTSQSYDDLAAGLENHGYEREGDLLVSDEMISHVGFTAITMTQDGLLVMAQSSELARAIADGEGNGPAMAEVLDMVQGPLRVAEVVEADSESCIDSLAAGWLGPASGEIVITVDDTDDASELELVPSTDDNPLADDLDIETPQIEGQTIRASYQWHGYGAAPGLRSILPGTLFRCP